MVGQIYVFTQLGFDLEESCSYAVHLEISFKVMLATFLLSEVALWIVEEWWLCWPLHVYLIKFVMLWCLKIWRLGLGGVHISWQTCSLGGDFDDDLRCYVAIWVVTWWRWIICLYIWYIVDICFTSISLEIIFW